MINQQALVAMMINGLMCNCALILKDIFYYFNFILLYKFGLYAFLKT
ncbi:protein of unknown function [Xenorhabdus poinarii G6]|uniref:Uncharacterized protein n=1 Tax=Xenorhabdus poinarii G6 TaxID=1354304 RepID=A0A068R3U6_9GAMM|nr:protein of unknown function [Xenorhabdus poinarii G6]